jgi:NAD-dependent SIR2 family protein deacetylase
MSNTEPIQKGWKELLSSLDRVLVHLPFAKVKSIGRRLGMLSIQFEGVDNLEQQIILDSVAHRFERMSATTCEHCGKKGLQSHKRTQLKERRVLCHPCYAIRLSDEYDESQKEQNNVLDS